MQPDIALPSTYRPRELKTGYANQTQDATRVQAPISPLDMTAGILAALMALGPLAMAAWGAHFGA